MSFTQRSTRFLAYLAAEHLLPAVTPLLARRPWVLRPGPPWHGAHPCKVRELALPWDLFWIEEHRYLCREGEATDLVFGFGSLAFDSFDLYEALVD
jgi:hypothetical protein